MTRAKKILVPTGFSEHARELIQYAAKMAEMMDADLMVASIIDSRDVDAVRRVSALGYDVDGEHYVKQIVEERKQILHEIIQETGFSPDRVKAVFTTGNPAHELLQMIVSERIEMVIMGTKGRTNLEYIFVGSVAEKIFRKSPVTVVSYRSQKQAESLRKHIKKRSH